MDPTIYKVRGNFYDTGTQNTSFLEFCKSLKELGVSCWYTPLEIKDISLAGVSHNQILIAMHDDTSDPLFRMRVLTECKHNIWFYLREVLRLQLSSTDFVALTGLVERIKERSDQHE